MDQEEEEEIEESAESEGKESRNPERQGRTLRDRRTLQPPNRFVDYV